MISGSLAIFSSINERAFLPSTFSLSQTRDLIFKLLLKQAPISRAEFLFSKNQSHHHHYCNDGKNGMDELCPKGGRKLHVGKNRRTINLQPHNQEIVCAEDDPLKTKSAINRCYFLTILFPRTGRLLKRQPAFPITQ